jgi:hypothetical protein
LQSFWMSGIPLGSPKENHKIIAERL